MPITDHRPVPGPDPAEWRPEYDEWVAKFLRPSVAGTPVVAISTPALPEPSWIKQAFFEAKATEQLPPGFKVYSDPTMRPGDIAVWQVGVDAGYGHVEIVPDRRRQSHDRPDA